MTGVEISRFQGTTCSESRCTGNWDAVKESAIGGSKCRKRFIWSVLRGNLQRFITLPLRHMYISFALMLFFLQNWSIYYIYIYRVSKYSAHTYSITTKTAPTLRYVTYLCIYILYKYDMYITMNAQPTKRDKPKSSLKVKLYEIFEDSDTWWILVELLCCNRWLFSNRLLSCGVVFLNISWWHLSYQKSPKKWSACQYFGPDCPRGVHDFISSDKSDDGFLDLESTAIFNQ